MVKPFKDNIGIYTSIGAVCVIVYFKCLFYGITNSDDEVLIAGNLPFLREIRNLLKVFTTDAFYLVKDIDLYRPLQSATFILDAQWGGDVVFNAHLTNLLLHIATCLTVYHLLLRLEFRQRLAFAGALVYAVHYNIMTAVAWIPARGDLLLGLCTFLALLTLIISLGKLGWRYILLHLLCFTMALFSKESGLVLPILFAVYLWSYRKIGLLQKKHLLLPAYYLAMGSFYWMLKTAAVAMPDNVKGLIPFIKNLRTLPEAVARFYLPVNMSTLPAYKLSATLSGTAIIAALVVLHYVLRSRLKRQAFFYPSWFLLLILPSMTYYPNFYSFSNDHIIHRSYVICFGLLMMTMNLVQSAALDTRKYFTHAVIMLLIYLSLLNLYFSRSYQNPAEFALRAIVTGSNSALAYTNYGIEKYKDGDDLEALRYFNQAIRICDWFKPALHYRAKIFKSRGMATAAIADIDRIISVAPDYDADEYVLRGAIKIDIGDYKGALEDFTKAVELDPSNGDAANWLHELEKSR